MTTTATKRMRLAALGLSTALSVGVLAPFIGTSSASAADCTTATASYSTASSKLATDQAKLKKAKKKYKKAKKHHASKRVVHKRHKKVKKLKHKVAVDKTVRNNYASQVTNCTTPGSGTTAPAATNPLDQLNSILGLLSGSGLSPAALTDALNAVANQIAASGVPGAEQLAGVIAQLSDALASGASQLDPSQLQTILGSLPSTMDPAAFQSALTDALGQAQAELTSALADPTSMTAGGLVKDIVDPLVTGLTEAGVPQLPDVLTQVENTLVPVLDNLGLSALGGGSDPAAAIEQALAGLTGGGTSITDNPITDILSGLLGGSPLG